MKRKYTTYLISFSIMLVLTLGISTNPYKVMSQGSNVKMLLPISFLSIGKIPKCSSSSSSFQFRFLNPLPLISK